MRMIQQGGVKLDGEKVGDKALRLKAGAVVVAQVVSGNCPNISKLNSGCGRGAFC